MQAADVMGKPVFVRELLPQDLKIEMNALDRKEAARVAGYLAAVVGEAHGRQMQGEERRAWYKELRRNRAKALNAPSWLWRSVVDLLLEHQRGYFEHLPCGVCHRLIWGSLSRLYYSRRTCSAGFPPAARHRLFAYDEEFLAV
jgi:Uncharacterized protein conserved in bacteria (DUF2252)